MDFVRSNFGTNEHLPVEHFFPLLFGRFAAHYTANRPKSEEKSVQLAEVHLYRNYFLQNPYFTHIHQGFNEGKFVQQFQKHNLHLSIQKKCQQTFLKTTKETFLALNILALLQSGNQNQSTVVSHFKIS